MPIALIILGLVALTSYSSIILFLLFGLLKLKNTKVTDTPFVSIVVAARNEGQNLKRCLNALLSQSYSKELIQIVIVNDRSTDNTQAILNLFSKQNTNLQTLQIKKTPENVSPKKHALSQAISQAKGELIFATDADCTPHPEWLSETVPLFKKDVGLVMGPAPFIEQKNLWSKLLALDNLATAFITAGATGWNIGVTCTGRNLAYRKTLFDEINGFEQINHSLSGDDDLFLQQVKKQTRWKLAYSLNPKTAVPSPPVQSFSSFVKQRRRHVSASKYYSRYLQAAFFIFNLANIFLYALMITAFFYHPIFLSALLLFGFKIVIDFIALNMITKKFNKQSLLLLFPAWEIFFVLNQTFISPLAFIGKITWK